MVFFNYALRKLNAKIVYYGPGLCGKTTNLQWIHDHFEGGERGKMISLATEGDRTIFFDLLPLEIGTIRGMDVTLQLYTVPGQVHYNSTRQLVLRGADGVVFVADSQRTMKASNVDSLRNLQENLLLQGVELAEFPHVLQFNKRDLRDLLSPDELEADLNQHGVPVFGAVATEGVGVQETLSAIVKGVMRNLREKYEPPDQEMPRAPGRPIITAGPWPVPASHTPAPGTVTRPQDAFTPPGSADTERAADTVDLSTLQPPPPSEPVPPDDTTTDVIVDESPSVEPTVGSTPYPGEGLDIDEPTAITEPPPDELSLADADDEPFDSVDTGEELLELAEDDEGPFAAAEDEIEVETVSDTSDPEPPPGSGADASTGADDAWDEERSNADTATEVGQPLVDPWRDAEQPPPSPAPEAGAARAATPTTERRRGAQVDDLVESVLGARRRRKVPDSVEPPAPAPEVSTPAARAPDSRTEPDTSAAPESAAAKTPDRTVPPKGPRRPVFVAEGDPFGDLEAEDSASGSAVVKAGGLELEARPVEVRAEDNQLHLRLQGTGAIAESGQVRALDIEVPVPGSWVGHRRVTLQLRLTLEPTPENDDV